MHSPFCHRYIIGAATPSRTEIGGLQSHRNSHYTIAAKLVVIDGVEPSSKAYETSALTVMLYHHWHPSQESSLNFNLRTVACFPLHYMGIEIGTLGGNRTPNYTFVACRDFRFTTRALFGAHGGSRTHKTLFLRQIRMPIPSHAHLSGTG